METDNPKSGSNIIAIIALIIKRKKQEDDLIKLKEVKQEQEKG